MLGYCRRTRVGTKSSRGIESNGEMGGILPLHDPLHSHLMGCDEHDSGASRPDVQKETAPDDNWRLARRWVDRQSARLAFRERTATP